MEAAAASLAAGTVGTETNGSIICPANVNGIVGFKPTVGVEFSGGQGGLRVEPQYWLTAEGRPEIAPAMGGVMARNLL